MGWGIVLFCFVLSDGLLLLARVYSRQMSQWQPQLLLPNRCLVVLICYCLLFRWRFFKWLALKFCELRSQYIINPYLIEEKHCNCLLKVILILSLFNEIIADSSDFHFIVSDFFSKMFVIPFANFWLLTLSSFYVFFFLQSNT